MCICTITPQQLELDLAHILKTPEVKGNDEHIFIPTIDEFKAAVEMTLRDSEWFPQMVEEYTETGVDEIVTTEVERQLERQFRNFDINDHVDMEREIDNALSNYDFDSEINAYLSNNFNPEDYVDNAVTEYLSRNVDVEEIANTEVHNILNDTDFIHALALAIVDVRKQQAAERKAKQDQLNQGDNNATL
jgi:hypothetical protein